MIVYVTTRGRKKEFIFDDVEELHISTDDGKGLQIEQADPNEYGFGWEVKEYDKKRSRKEDI